MPYPSEHSARIKSPDLFKTGDDNWGSKNIATGIRIILGILKSNDKWETQAYRFKADKFTVAEAKKWLKDHDVKYISFEPATGEKKESIPDDCERRVMTFEDAEMRVTDDAKPKIMGYAAKYGIFTDLGYFREKIKSGAFDDVLKDKETDVRCLKNHDPNLILGRTKSGTLRIDSNTVGLKFENDMPDTTTGRDTLEEIRRGDISGASFAFTVSEDEWKYTEDEPAERTIIKIGQLFDVSPCTYPAYPDTTVAARSLEKVKAEHIKPAENRTEEIIPVPEVKDVVVKTPEVESPEVLRERMRKVEAGYKMAGRIINRIKSKTTDV